MKPTHQVKQGSVRASIWENESKKGRYFSVKLSKLYKKNDKWESTQSFSRYDLEQVAKVCQEAATWIAQTGSGQSEGEDESGGEEPPFVNRILLGDCTALMPELPSASVDFVLTDPPYLVRYRSRDGRTIANDDNASWLEPAFREIHRVLKPHSFCVSFYGWNSAELFLEAWKRVGFRPVGHFVFVKHYASKVGFTRASHECAYLLAKGNPARPEAPIADVLPWRYSGNTLHPTQKPLAALMPLITAFSQPGDLVLDPFAGSGTTAVAARKLGRRFLGIELEAHYYEAARERLAS